MATSSVARAAPARLAVRQDVAARPNAQAALSEWWFYIPYLASIVIYFSIIETGARVYVPAIVPAAVAGGALVMIVYRRAAIPINRRVAQLLLAWLTLCLISMAMSQTADYYALRKMILPAVGIAPGLFYFRITRYGALAFTFLLFIVALRYTTQSANVESEGFASTYSPYESILGVAFGLMTVWYFAERRWLLAALAFAACLLFFKRNAIGLAVVVSALFALLALISQRPRQRVVRAILISAAIGAAVASFFLVDIYQFLAENLFRTYTAESLGSGRSTIYRAISYQLAMSSTAEHLLGHGVGAIEEFVGTTTYIPVNLGLAHNEYLSLYFDLGLAGVALVIVMLLRCASASWGSLATLLFIILAMLGENLFLIPFNCMAAFFLVSAVMAREERGVR